MADIDWPADLAPGAGSSFYLQPSTKRHEGVYSRQQQTLGLAPPRFVATLVFTRGGRDAGRIDALVALMDGGQRTASLFDWRRPFGFGDVTSSDAYAATVPGTSFSDGTTFTDGTGFVVVGDGSPRSDAVAAGATTATLRGFAPGRLVRAAGDYIGFGAIGCQIVTLDAVSDSNGRVTVQFRPPLRVAAPAGPVRLGQVRTTFTLTSDDAGQNPTDRPDRGRWSLQFVESLNP